MIRTQFVAPVLAALVTLIYLPSVVGGEFLNYDDPYLVVHSAAIHEARLAQIVDPRASRADLGSEYLPVRDLSYVLDAQLYGKRGPGGLRLGTGAAVGFRLTNLLWYALACALCAAFLWRLLEAARSRDRRWVALLAALLFALHPVHAESAAWIAGRKDVVSAALVFAALLVHLHAREGDRLHLYGASLVLAGLACLAKSTATALPFLILAVEVWNPAPGRASWKRRLVRVLPSLAVCTLAVVLAVWVGRSTGISENSSIRRLIGRLLFDGVGVRDLVILRHYLVLAFAPFDLRITHHALLSALHPQAGQPGLHAGLAFFLCLAPLTGLLLWRRRPRALFVAVWFLGGLLPVLNLVPLSQWLADRFLCLPVLGPCIALALGLGWVRRRRPKLGRGLAATVLVVWAGLAAQRGLEFRTSVTLWSAQVSDDPHDSLALGLLGEAILIEATRANDPQRAREAATTLERSVDAYAASPLASPSHELEARVRLGQARLLAEEQEAALRAWTDAYEVLRQKQERIPRARSWQRVITRFLQDLAVQAATDGRPQDLERAARAMHAAGNGSGTQDMLRQLAEVDPQRAEILTKELRRP